MPMKTHIKMPVYTDELPDGDWRFAGQKPLTQVQQKALGIPDPSEAAKIKIVRKPARPASVLHMVAKENSN